jgi:hypothetical protein
MEPQSGWSDGSADALTESVAQALFEGKSSNDIVKALVKQGVDELGARGFVTDVAIQVESFRHSPDGRALMARKYRTKMIHGALWLVGGTVVTALTASTAADGGYFLVAWGAILFGGIGAIAGFIGWMKWR